MMFLTREDIIELSLLTLSRRLIVILLTLSRRLIEFALQLNGLFSI